MRRITYLLFHHPSPSQPSTMVAYQYRVHDYLQSIPSSSAQSATYYYKSLSTPSTRLLTGYFTIHCPVSHLLLWQPIDTKYRITYRLFHHPPPSQPSTTMTAHQYRVQDDLQAISPSTIQSAIYYYGSLSIRNTEITDCLFSNSVLGQPFTTIAAF
jgi:hypothetical protein